MQNSIQDMYEQICNYKYVSFDLFDTLIKRSVSIPEQIFELVEIKFNADYQQNISDFKQKRVQAEKKARELKTKEDITLNDIYNNLNYEKSVCETLMKEEIDMEITTCCPNISLIKLLHMCLWGGQNVIVTTDMYLDRDTVSRILNKIGVVGYRLFLSSEIGYTKQTGTMYDYIISTLNISPSELVHIGDNKNSDYDNAMKKGIRAIWLKERKECLKYWKKNKDKNIHIDHLYSILKNKDIFYAYTERKLGYKLLGPILFNFCMWLNREDKINSFDKIVFIAREGYLPYFVYKALFSYEKDKILYLKINKNSLRLPMLYINDSIHTFFNLIPEKSVYSILDIIKFLYIDRASKEISNLLAKYNYSFNSVVKRSEMLSLNSFIAFYKECIKIQKNEIERQYRFLLRYFIENDLKGKIALVNNSINANAQFYLQLIKENSRLNMEFWGIHFIISKSGIHKIKNQCSVWFDYTCRQFEKRLFYRNCLIFEHLLFEPQGTALYYVEKNGKIEVVCEEHEYELENDKVIEGIKSGVMEFVDDYVKRMPLCTNPSLNLNALCNFYLKPVIEDARLVCNLKDDDYVKNDLFQKWVQGRMVLSNRVPIFYNLKLHLELILRRMF